MLIPALFSRELSAILAIALIVPTLADEFTNPSNASPDLSVTYSLGQSVSLAWDCSLSRITLLVSHWGGAVVGVLLTDAKNAGVFTWNIGESDNINDEEISKGTNFVLLIRDPTGQTGTGNGFINGTLQSRGFRIKSNVGSTTSSASSSLSPTSLLSTSILSTAAAPPPTPTPASGLNRNAKLGVGFGVGIGVPVLIAMSVGLTMLFTRRRKSQAGNAIPPVHQNNEPTDPKVVPTVPPNVPPIDPKPPTTPQIRYSELSGESRPSEMSVR